MANIFNAVTTGIGGISVAGDTSGSFAFAKDGTTVATISGTGVVNATQITGLTTALTAAQGGTGLTSPGTSGNVLTSNGSTWTSSALPAGGVTSLNGQTGAITNTDLYAIGSYITGRPQNGTAYAVNSTIAGSSLYTTSNGAVFYEPSANQWRDYSNATLTAATFATLINTGTWRCVSPAGTKTQFAASGTWVRIS